MDTNPNELEQLRQQLADLQKRQDVTEAELKRLTAFIRQTMLNEQTPQQQVTTLAPKPAPVVSPALPVFKQQASPAEKPKEPAKPTDWERFIGENLSNKIGAFITVLGVGIGLKYVIDNDLIGPVGRIIMGYVIAVVMLVVSQRIREKFTDLSAVIFGGAACIAYFTSYAAFDFYQLMPQGMAFVIMVGITVVTVWQALSYNQQVIAFGGLVGAYFIPFLLSNDTDNPAFLFAYMSIINGGILYISTKKDWKLTYYAAFLITWWIFFEWSNQHNNVVIQLLFSSIFFLIFTAAYLFKKLQLKSPDDSWDQGYLVINGGVFLFTGYLGAKGYEADWLTGAFLMYNVLIYAGLAYTFYRYSGQVKPFGLFVTLGVICLTLFVPDQWDQPFTSIGWSLELVALFWAGRQYRLLALERLLAPFLFLLAIDLLLGLTPEYYKYFWLLKGHIPLWNKLSLAYLSVIAALGVVYGLWQREQRGPAREPGYLEQSFRTFPVVVAGMIVVGIYFYFFNEIACYFNLQHSSSYRDNTTPAFFDDILSFKTVWLINYTLFFMSTLNFWANRRQISNTFLEILTVLSIVSVLIFLMAGLYELGFLKNCYQLVDAYSDRRGLWHLGFRYVSMGFVGLLLWSLRRMVRNSLSLKVFADNFDLLLHGTALWIVSSELVHWLELYGFGERSYKTALSILFGCWSVVMTILGIRQERQALRIAAMTLFSATLLKLFAYDLANLSTISKTVVLVSLGGLLLGTSYLYTKFYKSDE